MASKRSIALLGIAVVLSCQRNPSPHAAVSVTETDSAGVTLVRISGDVSSLPLLTMSEEPVAEISGEAPPFLGSIGEVEILSDGSLLVEDNQTDELRLFDSTGQIIRLVGGPGEGPGEFKNLTELSVTAGDTFVAYDRRTYRVSVFDPAGELVRTIALQREDGARGGLALDAWGFDSEHFLLHRLGPWDSTDTAPLPKRDERAAILWPFDTAGTVRGESVRFDGGYSISLEFGDAGSPFAPRPIVDVHSGHLVYGSGVEYELVISTGGLEPDRIVTWGGWGEPLTDERVQVLKDEYDTGWADEDPARMEIYKDLSEALFSPSVLPDTLPALLDALPDETGRVWVSRFQPSNATWSQEDSWHLLDSDGHPIARIALPPNSRMVAARGEQVVLVMRDSLNVEHLRTFKVAGTHGGSR